MPALSRIEKASRRLQEVRILRRERSGQHGRTEIIEIKRWKNFAAFFIMKKIIYILQFFDVKKEPDLTGSFSILYCNYNYKAMQKAEC